MREIKQIVVYTEKETLRFYDEKDFDKIKNIDHVYAIEVREEMSYQEFEKFMEKFK